MKIRKGDNVIAISGKDKGKSGKVLRALPKSGKVIVDGLNVVKRHQRPRKANQQGQIIDKSMPLTISNVQLLDPKDNKPTRVGYKTKGDKKVRIAKRSGTELES